MSTELTVINNNVDLQKGGVGIDFSNPLFQLKPATLGIVQKNSSVEGAVTGKLRISDTGDQFDSITAVLLQMPSEQRQYHIGQPGELNRIAENLVCYSRDMLKPDIRSKIPQAMTCANCVRSSWDAWRDYKDKNNGQSNKSLIPPCDPSYYLVILDTVYQLPLQMFIRSKARDPFESGMQNLARVIAMGKAQGKSPNIYDVSFEIGTKQITTGKFQSYVPTFTNFKFITEEQREAFGAVYLQYIAQRKQKEETVTNNVEATASEGIDSQVLEGDYVSESIDEEIPF